MDRARKENGRRFAGARGHYPPAHTAPWFFVILALATLALILAGVFRFDPLTRLVHYLAVVL